MPQRRSAASQSATEAPAGPPAAARRAAKAPARRCPRGVCAQGLSQHHDAEIAGAQASPSTCCSGISVPRPASSGRRWYFRSRASSTGSRRSGRHWFPTTPTKTNWPAISSNRSTTWSSSQGSAPDAGRLEAFSEEEVAEAGIADIRRALRVLGRISVEGMQLRGLRSNQPDLPAHSTMAMIVGMVALRSSFFGSEAALTRRDCRRTRRSDSARIPARGD